MVSAVGRPLKGRQKSAPNSKRPMAIADPTWRIARRQNLLLLHASSDSKVMCSLVRYTPFFMHIVSPTSSIGNERSLRLCALATVATLLGTVPNPSFHDLRRKIWGTQCRGDGE